jgi:ethanolamine utilization microcompartment shell protein EutL
MSITLTAPYTMTIRGTQVENDTIGACTGMSMDYLLNIMTYNFAVGTLSGSPANLSMGPYAQTNGANIIVAVYVGPTTTTQTFGQWWLNGILQATIVPSANLTASVTQLLANRNTAEGFVAVAGGLMPGTQVPWTQL